MKGLTLLEVLVAVSITALVLTAVYGAFTSNMEVIELARDKGQVYQTARIVMDRMIKDLECAFIAAPIEVDTVKLGMVSEDEEIDGRPADRIHFSTLAHLSVIAGAIQTDLCEVSYSLEEDEDGDGLLLFRRDEPVPDDTLSEGGARQEMTEMVKELDLTFEDEEGDTHDAWNSLEGDQKDKLPSLIRIRMVLSGPQGYEYLFTTSVNPHAAAGG